MRSYLKHEEFYYGALLYVFLIPFPQKLVNISLIIWIALSLISFKKDDLVKKMNLLLLPAFYVLYFIGLYTAETASFKFLEYKLSLLVFPLLFFLHEYDENQRTKIQKVFVLGLASSAVICLVVAFYNSIGLREGFHFEPNVLEGKGFIESILYGGNYFFGRYLSIFHQTVYYALYLCSGVAILLFQPKLYSLRIRFVLLGFFVVVIFLISNKASFIALIAVLALRLLTWKAKDTKKLVGASIFAMALIAFLFLNPRIKETVAKVVEGQLILNQESRYGFATRLLSWDAAISLIKEKPILGYGHIDTQLALNKKYEEKGYVYPLREKYNAHNLWLQSWLENGVLSVFLLFGIFFFLLKEWLPRRHVQPLLLAFVIILLINSMFEGLFNRFSGISFFSFLVCFIFSISKGGQTKT